LRKTAIFSYVVGDVLAEASAAPPTEYVLDKTYLGKECNYTMMNVSYNFDGIGYPRSLELIVGMINLRT
jgi:hypothetical protein